MADRSLADRLAAMQSSADTEEEFDEILISRHSPPVQNRIVKLPLDRLVDYADEHFEEITGRPQPFRLYDEDSLRSLADSIRENGVMQPIIVRPLPDGSYQVDADQSVSDVFELFGFEDPEENEELINTLMGEWAYEQFAAIPKTGESFEYHGLRVTVTEMEHNRILKLNVSLAPQAKEGGEQ